MNKPPIISVVMSVYNGEKYLDEAIQSILTQTYKDFEFIIINDGSTDKSLEIIEKYKKNDERIVLISRENKGLIASLNEGIEKAKGKYIARMDADDICLPSRFEEQFHLMEKENIDICGCHYAMINKKGKYIDTIYTPLNNDSLFLYIILAVPFAHGSAMIKKEFLSKNNLKYGQNAKYAEDKSLWCSMFNRYAKFANVDKVLFEYREFNQSLSKIRSKEITKDDKNLKSDFINNNLVEIKKSIIKLSNDFDSLSFREIEHLLDLSLLIFLKTKELKFLKVLKKANAKQKIIAIFKFISKIL